MRPILVAAVLLAAGPACAAGTATIEATGPQGPQPIHVAWNDDGAMRLGFPGREVYLVLRDDRLYSVTTADGAPLVMNLTAMGRLALRLAGDEGIGGVAGALGLQPARAVAAVEPTGASARIAGRPAREFAVTWTDDAGRERTDAAMLSDDPLVVELTRAFGALAAASPGAERPDPRLAAIGGRGLGTLAYGDRFTVTAIDEDAPPPEIFALPAAPAGLLSLSSLGGKRR